jgi:flagellin
MALVINTNVASLQTQKALVANQSSLDTAIQRLSSGLRINSASDDAAGLSIANRMDSQIRGLNQAVRNAGDAISLAQASEGAMDEITAMLQRMRELSVQSSNGTLTTADRDNLQAEVAELKSEIDRVVSTTTFNGKTVLDGSFGESMQIGTNAGDSLTVSIANMGTISLGGISGAASNTAITKASAAGVQAKTTETLVDFSANDTYSLSVTVTVDAQEYTYSVKGDVANGSAKEIVDLLNAKLRDKPDAIDKGASATLTTTATDLSSIIEVSYVGRQVTIKNLQGGDINVQSGTTLAVVSANEITVSGNLSSGGGQAFVSAVSGADSGSTSGVLADSRFTKTRLQNTNTTAYSAKVATATPGTAAITFGSTGLTLTSANTFKVSVGGTSISVGFTGVTPSTATIATKVKEAISGAALTGFSAAVSGSTVTVTKADGSDFGFAVHTVSANTMGSITVSDTSGTAAALTVGTTGKTITGGTPTSSGSPGGVMYLDLLNNDTYTFTFADDSSTPAAITSVTVTYDGTASSLEGIAAAIDAGLSKTGYDFTASVSEGRIKILEKNGKAFELSNFASTGAGKVVASVETGQGASSVDAVLLDDVTPGTTFTTKGAGAADKTDIDLSFYSHTDTFSFSISDGTATARVSATAGVTAVTATATTIKNAVTTALARAGLDDVMSVRVATGGTRTAADAAGAFTLTLEHKLGYEVTIGDFASDSLGEMLVKSGSAKTTGQAAFLNDNLGGSSADQVVSTINISTTNGASSAIDVIDRAISDVDSQRSKLGAIQNRLNHTVSNLINISTNTADAKSRIMDADYSVEAANLAKSQIMQQAATAMLAQANASQQSVLSLLT